MIAQILENLYARGRNGAHSEAFGGQDQGAALTAPEVTSIVDQAEFNELCRSRRLKMRGLRTVVLSGVLLALFFLGSARTATAICSDCGTIYGDEWCVYFPPNFLSCRTFPEYEIIWVPGDCGTCPGHFVRIVYYRCEAYGTCAV